MGVQLTTTSPLFIFTGMAAGGAMFAALMLGFWVAETAAKKFFAK